MMIKSILPVIFAMMTLSYQTTNTADAGLHRRERELAARLHWDILWNEAPEGLRVPKTGTARLAAYLTGKAFWYCSHDLGVCAQYRVEDRHLGDRIESIKSLDEQDDRKSVLKFAGQNPKLTFPTEIRTGRLPLPDSAGILWTAAIELGTREEIVNQYKQLRPVELKGLLEWARTKHQDSGYRSITIACFAPSDPTVFIYGDRPAERSGPIVFQVFWDREREEWVVAGMLERRQGPETFEKLKATVQAIACGKIRFK